MSLIKYTLKYTVSSTRGESTRHMSLPCTWKIAEYGQWAHNYHQYNINPNEHVTCMKNNMPTAMVVPSASPKAKRVAAKAGTLNGMMG